jgi:hypothetical protein
MKVNLTLGNHETLRFNQVFAQLRTMTMNTVVQTTTWQLTPWRVSNQRASVLEANMMTLCHDARAANG